MDRENGEYPGEIVNFQKVRLIIGISYGIIKKIVFFKNHRGCGTFSEEKSRKKVSEILCYKEI